MEKGQQVLNRWAHAIILLFAIATGAAAQQQRQSNITGQQVVGNAVAAEFGKWQAKAVLGVATAGAATISIDTASLVVPDGMGIMPINTATPIRITGDGNVETVTPSSVNCSSGSGICTFTATFTYAHPNTFQISSGTYGLQEAITFQSGRGGMVLVTPEWQGTTSQITNATGATNTSVWDMRAGSISYYIWDGSHYVAGWGVTAAGGLTPASLAQVANLNNVRFADYFAGADIGAKVNAAYADLPATGGAIGILAQNACRAFTMPIVLNTISKPVVLFGLWAPSGNTNDSSQGGVCLNYTPTTATVAITMDWTATGGNGFFGAGSGMRDITLINNGSCETQGGCGSSAIGLKIGGTNGGVQGARFQNIKLQGFGTCVSNPDTTSTTVWGNVFDNTFFKSCTTGISIANASEGWRFDGGGFVNGGRAVNVTGNANVKFFDTHFDNNSNADAISCVANSVAEFTSAYFENVNLDSGTYPNRHFYTGTCLLKIIGGNALDSVGAGNTDYWFQATSGGIVSGLNISSAGRTATQVFGFSAPIIIEYFNSSATVLTAVCPNSTSAVCIDAASTGGPSVGAPTVRLRNSAGGTILQPTAGAGSNTITFGAANGTVLTSGNDARVQRFSTNTTCTTAATAGTTCTTADITLPVTFGDATYGVWCSLVGPTNVPEIGNIVITDAQNFKIRIVAQTAAAASYTSAVCWASHL